MPINGQPEAIPGHTDSVVCNHDQALSALVERDIHPRCPGIDRIFHQFLDCRGRALHYLAGGDAVHQDRRQQADLIGHLLHTLCTSDRRRGALPLVTTE